MGRRLWQHGGPNGVGEVLWWLLFNGKGSRPRSPCVGGHVEAPEWRNADLHEPTPMNLSFPQRTGPNKTRLLSESDLMVALKSVKSRNRQSGSFSQLAD